MADLRISRFVLVTILLVCPLRVVRSFAQAERSGTNQQDQSRTAPFVGCYELTLGRWWPWSFGEETKYVTPPNRVQLLPERGKIGFEQDGFLLRAMAANKDTKSARGGPSYWQVKSSNRIDLTWTDGFTGVSLRLEKDGNDLHGWAHPHFDAPKFVPRTTHVIARRIACDAAQPKTQ
jgi:hypothetical protein